ncbi:TPA: YccE family protein [Escherichia coli]|uniref:YccE family protein n=1 Tax=Escherichia coli TaxID=562 RepID=UPI0011C937EE|nr:YccE family protein [Escherichia coli]WOG34371.1 bacterial effector [uncultured bacterium]EIN2862871.1 YccE family protein [Escherichia coli]EIN8119522.1 YccE family protein [Escherichia coli]EJS8705462.1 YccE family protein [Escherichia coli]MCD6718047.1 YccE family protein [Escherichia coli]
MGSNIHGISCTANNYLKQAWNDIKNEYEKNQTYSITLFENTLVCFMRLYNELRRKVNEEDIPCLECESLEKQLYEMQNDNDLSSFLKTLHAKDTKIYSGVSGGFTYTIKYSQERELVIISLPYRSSETIADFKGYCWLNFIKFIESLCDDVFSEYFLDDENMSIQPEWINTPGISDLDSGIDLSGISFIQSEINKTYGLKYAPVDGDGYCLLRAILVLKEHEYSWALGSHKTQKQVYEEFIKIVDKQTIEALVDTAFNDLREDVKTLFGVELQSDNKIQGEGGFLSWSFLSFKKEFIDSCLNDKKCILHLPEFIFNDNKAHLVLDSAPEKRINEVKNFLTALSDSICSLFIVNSNVASISLGNESFSTDEDLEYGYLINTGNHYDVYLPPELFAQAYKLRNKEMNAQLDYLNRYAI